MARTIGPMALVGLGYLLTRYAGWAIQVFWGWAATR